MRERESDKNEVEEEELLWENGKGDFLTDGGLMMVLVVLKN